MGDRSRRPFVMDDDTHKPQNDGEAMDPDDEEVNGVGYKSVKDAVLFAIDISTSMMTIPAPIGPKKMLQESPVSAALKCAYHLMQQRIISNPNDSMGILLFGTAKSKFQDSEENNRGSLSYPHCYLLADLNVPAAEDVRALKSMVENPEEFGDLLVPSEEPVSMANVLFCANQIFTTKAPNFVSRRLFIVTDNDKPHFQDKSLRAAATVRAKDLYDLGVTIDLFPISRPGHDFDQSDFYDDIIYRVNPTDPAAPVPIHGPAPASSGSDGISLLQNLLSSINSKSTPRRALFSNLPLEIAPGLKIGVKGYIVFKRQIPARSCYVWLKGEQALIAKGSTTQLADSDARPVVGKADIKKAYKFGGEQIPFTPEEISSIRNFGDPIIRIIGFKPLSKLPFWASVKQSTFIYPCEEDYIGSTRVFAALHQNLLTSNLMGVSWLIARRNAAPVIAAVIPGPEQLSESVPRTQLMPAGLWLTPIPYADDIRRNPETVHVTAPDSLIDMMRTIIQQLQLPGAEYKPEKYPSPALQWHYRILQALALEEDMPETPEDKTIPRYRQIEKRCGGYVLEWGRELERLARASGGSRVVPGVKRTAAAHPAASEAKRPKATAGDAITDDEMRAHFEARSIHKLTLVALKAWLDAHHLLHAGKKAELVEQVEQFFESK